jgi:hypothetical protein
MKNSNVLLITLAFLISPLVLAEEVSPFDKTPMELILKGSEEIEATYIASGFLRCGSLLTLIDTMMELSFGEPVFDNYPGKKMSGLGYNVAVKLAKKRGSKYTDQELMHSVANEQAGYDKIYMSRMQNNKLKSGDFFKEDAVLKAEMKECLEIASAF